MRSEQWEEFKKVAKIRNTGHIPMPLIVDSVWISTYLGIKHIDYYFDQDVWFQANL